MEHEQSRSPFPIVKCLKVILFHVESSVRASPASCVVMLFYSFYQTLAEKSSTITVELKNDLQITGTLTAVDQFLNLKLANVRVNDAERYPHLLSVKTCFVRGSVVRYVHLPKDDVEVELLQDGARREATAKH